VAWPDKPDEPFLRQLFSTKFVHWSYEDEYRLWVGLSDPEDGHYYYDFSKDVALREVIVGEASEFTRKDISEALGDLAPTVEAFRARPAFRSFRVVRNRNHRLWK
jgi:hypothetical protein